MWEITKAAINSVGRFIAMVFRHNLRLKKVRIGKLYKTDDDESYAIFRETISTKDWPGKPTVLVVGFRLKLIRSNRFMHWMFQRACILTTPFWSGFNGFKVKLWMVNPKTKDYLGIYDWSGKDNARFYVEALVLVLRPLSVKGSVWYKIHPRKLEEYLSQNEIKI